MAMAKAGLVASASGCLPPELLTEDFTARLRSRCEISTWHGVSSDWDRLTYC